MILLIFLSLYLFLHYIFIVILARSNMQQENVVYNNSFFIVCPVYITAGNKCYSELFRAFRLLCTTIRGLRR